MSSLQSKDTSSRLDQKYIVHKAWDSDSAKLDDEDFFVLRKGDVWAAPALHAYASFVLSTVELSRIEDPLVHLTAEQRQTMMDYANAVAALALTWQMPGVSHKIPD
jgi:hypothetical protein